MIREDEWLDAIDLTRKQEAEIAALKAERDQMVAHSANLSAEINRLRAALEGMVKALEDGEEQGFLHMHIVTALDIARRALEGE
jgi:hypothetical protein